VLACCAGAIRTPGFAKAAGSGALGAMEPETVAERALRALGRGPVLVPGLVNKLAAFAMTRLLPQRAAIAVMAASTAILSGAGGGAST